jgi:propionyl-CoA synthetase
MEEMVMTSSYAEVYGSWSKDPEGFWLDQAAEIDWFTKPETAFDPDLGVYGGWFPDGITNTCHNCLDRHVAAGRGEQAAT